MDSIDEVLNERFE